MERARGRWLKPAKRYHRHRTAQVMAFNLQLRKSSRRDLLAHGPPRQQCDPPAVLHHKLYKVCVIRFEREFRAYADLLEEIIGRAADRGPALEKYQPLALDLLDRSHALAREAVPAADDEQQLVL